MINTHPEITELFFWLGVISMSPMLFKLSMAATKYFLNNRKSNTTLIISIKEENGEEYETTVQLNSKSLIVEQLSALKKGASHE